MNQWINKRFLNTQRKRRLEFREDPTNSSDQYLRNRIREQFNESEIEFERKLEIWQLWQKQKKLKTIINQGCVEILPAQGQAWERKWFENLDQNVCYRTTKSWDPKGGESINKTAVGGFSESDFCLITLVKGLIFQEIDWLGSRGKTLSWKMYRVLDERASVLLIPY